MEDRSRRRGGLTPQPVEHPFVDRPHRTLLALSFPVLVSLIAEPLTGLADTTFVARLGTAPLSALGVATTLLSSVFWAFNFLGIGTQTRVAQRHGADDAPAAREAAGTAIALAGVLGAGLTLVLWPTAAPAAAFMSSDEAVQSAATTYLEIRLLGGPAILVMMAAFGALRGIQDMRTPLAIAVVQNALNIALDALLIFGTGPVPALGIAGAAWASVISQVIGAAWAVAAVRGELGRPPRIAWRRTGQLLVVGADLFVRTGALLLFMLVATRQANRLGADSGAAHQVVRQFWITTAFVLDAFGAAAQSLIGYFVGARRVDVARRVAGVACLWGLAAGVALCGLMVLAKDPVARWFLPDRAHALFGAAWLTCAFAQPVNALAFVTDGIHWGTADFAFLRNVMLASTATGLTALWLAPDATDGLLVVWIVTAGWIGIRTLFGLARIWPAIGRSPLHARGAVRGAV